ncbi:MAG: helix-turn-helix domain-containing protein, partial [Clostridiales bacterium]|nr:helix-turn-helix domain-containing protein [Clostridiales bacterium]
MTTGQKIYECRKKAGMTQEELADRLGVSRQAVSKWESDMAFPETEKILELCKLFSLSADELLFGQAQAEESQSQPVQEDSLRGVLIRHAGNLHYEYISKTKVFGLPLVHVNIGLGMYRAKGIFAIGNIATGFVSLGFLSVGLLSFGLLALGLLAFGTVAIGLLLGAGAVGVGALAFGGVA